MKKILIIFIIVCVNGFAWSQITITPQVGINVSKLQNPVVIPRVNIEVDEIIGFQFGGNVRIGGAFHIEPGIYFHEIGSDFKIFTDDIPELLQNTIKINIVQVPLSIGYRILKVGLFDIRIHAGGSLSFVTKVKDEIERFLTKDDFNDTVWGLVGGAGFDVLFLSVDANFEYGLSDMLRTELFKTKNNVFRINAGIKL